jgi:valyl-tRNA synthetase
MSTTEPASQTTPNTLDGEMPKAYDPRETEPRWYDVWEKSGLFRATGKPGDPRPTYVVAIPPPNVTGSLHMGHACRVTFEDVLIRHKRMSGFDTLWMPGIDHAGIATQVVVERLLKAEGKTRHDLGRAKFLERVWQWKEQSGDRILMQQRKLGASCDWERTRFTMDEGYSRAVREVFVRLYEEGLMYRATRLVNWDVETRTVLSDLEVETEENVQGELFEFAYPVEGGGEVVVATTRPETMLGDTAVAVHPDDPRYAHLHGKFVTHPFAARRVPVICDGVLVDMKFGTGVVKVTPAHDPNDFATGKRHGLEELSVIGLDGRMTEACGEFAGLDRFAARKAVKARLEVLGLARGSKPHVMTLPRSQRSGTVVEPMISTQWFVKMEPLAGPAIEAVESGRVQILPEEWTKTYYHWMRNIQDWCVSRQLWWGHEIPAWHCEDCEHVNVARTAPTACSKCQSTKLRQDPDVLDTWFSSALWPFATLGWPDKTPALERYYPTSDMETGFDILFFWVARMIVMGVHIMGEVPFRRVLLAGLVTDERGEKMSKVKGNVVDPIDVLGGSTLEALLEKASAGGAKPSGLEYLRKTYPEGFAAYGADALRMTLLSYAPAQRKIALSIKRIEGYRNFANKLWNATRYALGKLEGSGAMATGVRPVATALANRWVLSRLDVAIAAANLGLCEYRFDDASGALYHFVWDELCDWYLELSKPLLQSDDAALVAETREVLVHVLETSVRALHPMMPFVTEELWSRLPKAAGHAQACIVAPYPVSGHDAVRDESAERELGELQQVIVAIRQVRSENEASPAKHLTITLEPNDAAAHALWSSGLAGLAGAVTNSELAIAALGQKTDAAIDTAVAVAGAYRVLVHGVVDLGKEKSRLEREIAKLDKDLASIAKKLDNEGFIARAPADVVEKERARRAELIEQRKQLVGALGKLG